MMVVHFPMAFLMGSVAFDVAAAVGLAVPAVVAGYLVGVSQPASWLRRPVRWIS
jgi:hypothetical protein